MKALVFVIILMGAIGAAPALAQKKAEPVPPGGPEDFQALFPLEGAAEGGLNRAVVSAEVLLKSQRSDLGDLAVFNGRGEIVPAVVAEAMGRVEDVEAENYELPIFPMSKTKNRADGAELRYDIKGGQLELRTHGPSEPQADSHDLYIIDASRPYGRGESGGELLLRWSRASTAPPQALRLKIETSDDLKIWNTLAADLTVLPAEGFGPEAGLAGGRIVIKALKPYLRLTWLEAAAPPLASARLASVARGRAVPLETLKANVSGHLVSDQGGAAGLIFDLGGRPPVALMNLNLTEAASLDGALWGRNNADENWARLQRVAIYRYAKAGAAEGFERNPPWPVAGGGYRYYKLTGGAPWPKFDPPPTLRLEFRPLEIIFLAQGGGPYRLAAGHENSPARPPLPAEARKSFASANQVSIGPPVAAPQRAIEAEPTAGWGEGQQALWLFRAVLALGLIILAILAMKLYAQMRDEKK